MQDLTNTLLKSERTAFGNKEIWLKIKRQEKEVVYDGRIQTDREQTTRFAKLTSGHWSVTIAVQLTYI